MTQLVNNYPTIHKAANKYNAKHSCSNTSLAVVRHCIVFTQSHFSVTSNLLLTPLEFETPGLGYQDGLFLL